VGIGLFEMLAGEAPFSRARNQVRGGDEHVARRCGRQRLRPGSSALAAVLDRARPRTSTSDTPNLLERIADLEGTLARDRDLAAPASDRRGHAVLRTLPGAHPRRCRCACGCATREAGAGVLVAVAARVVLIVALSQRAERGTVLSATPPQGSRGI